MIHTATSGWAISILLATLLFLLFEFPIEIEQSKSPIVVTQEQEVKTALKGIEVLIFKAKWCGPCNSTAMQQLPKDLRAKGIAVRIIDIDASPELTTKYNIEQIPTTIVLQDGKVIEQKVGVIEDSLLILKIIARVLMKVIPYLMEFWEL